MWICVPTEDQNGLDARVGGHFGRVPFYTFVDTERDEVKVIENAGVHHGPGLTPAQIIAQEGADVLLCFGLGRRAIGIFEQEGIHVYIQASGTVRDAIKAYQRGQLPEATDADACAQHAYRRERHVEEECEKAG